MEQAQQLDFESAAPPPDAPEAEEAQEPSLADLQAQIAEAQRTAAEAKREAEHQAALRQAAEDRSKFWEQQQAKRQQDTPLQEQQIEDWGDPLDFVTSDNEVERKQQLAAFASRIDKRIEERAKQIAAEISRQQIDQTTRSLSALEQHFQRLPELRDPNSEIFQLSSRYGQEMKNDARYAGLDASIIAERAIERAELDLLRAGKLSQPAAQEPPPQPDYTQQRRQAMQASQQPSMGRRSTSKPSNGIPPGYSQEDVARIDEICAKNGMTRQQYFDAASRVRKFRE